MWSQAVASRLFDYEGNLGVCVGKEDHVGVVKLDKPQKVIDDRSLRSFQPSLAAIENFDAGDLPRHGRISGHL